MELRILYRERAVGDHIGATNQYDDMVLVELRKWSDGNGYTDYVLEQQARIDGDYATDSVEVLRGPAGGPTNDAKAIREAIRRFDYLLYSHPSKDRMQ